MTKTDEPTSRVGSLLDLAPASVSRELAAAQTAMFREFARKRGLPTDGPNWELGVMVNAGFEHPELQFKRKPGRPRKFATLKDCRTDSQRRAAEALDLIERRIAEAKGRGDKPPKAVDVVREIVAEGTSPSSPTYPRMVRAMHSGICKEAQARRRQARARASANSVSRNSG